VVDKTKGFCKWETLDSFHYTFLFWVVIVSKTLKIVNRKMSHGKKIEGLKNIPNGMNEKCANMRL
jgi:hypothetical protein